MSGSRSESDRSEFFDADREAGWEIFAALAGNCPVAMFATDSAGRHIFVNQRWCDLTGIAAQDALEYGWERVVHPTDILELTGRWRRLVTQSDSLRTRVRLIRPGGETFDVVVHAVAVPSTGGPRRFVGTLTPSRLSPDTETGGSSPRRNIRPRDSRPPDNSRRPFTWMPGRDQPAGRQWTAGRWVAGRWVAEGQLRSPFLPAPRLHPPTGTAPDTPTGTVPDTHPFGDPPPTESGTDDGPAPETPPLGIGRHGATGQQCGSGCGAAVERHEVATSRRSWPPAHTGEGHLSGAGRPPVDPGAVADRCGCLFDELMRANTACRDRDDRLEALLGALPDAVLIADADSTVVAVNEMFCDLFELAEDPADVIGVDCRVMAAPPADLVEDPAVFTARLDLLLRRRRAVRDEEVTFSDGRVFARSHLPVFSGDLYSGHLWIYVDVTDRRILEAETEWLLSDS